MFFNVTDIIELRSDLYIQTFIRSKVILFRISLQLDILCTSVVKWFVLKITVYRSRVTCFPAYQTSQKATDYSGLSLANFLFCNSLQQKWPETLSAGARSVTLLSPISQEEIKGAPERLLNRAPACLGYITTYVRHVKFMLSYWCSQSALIVNYERTVQFNIILELIGICGAVWFFWTYSLHVFCFWTNAKNV